ncbi:thiamine biosynthesis protein [Trichloromonas sp.]|uniref:thiamine biosynthesis protein n=1 Tax=Trichloromonas sp. TaxID=3069249 RepID=UPI002A3DBE8A|nr:thiamine biosynthesis protein [Trichloromonas sp.]
MSKGLGLLSGGLDSILAALALRRQGVEIACVAFVTPFFGAERSLKTAQMLDFPLQIRDISEIHLAMLKSPRYGYGKNMNPCIDCHALMYRLAGDIMEEKGFDFLFSGEVLGQRPMSQNLSALRAVANHSGYPKRILRPLSARLLPITAMEDEGLVDRERLLDIQGRSRRRQQELATEWGIVDYPSSGGGCLLTESSFSGRLRDLFVHRPEADVTDVELLKVGRQFRLSPKAQLAVGRNQSDNEAIKRLVRPSDTLIRADNFSGPLGLVSGDAGAEELAAAGAIVVAYGKGRDKTTVRVLLQQAQRKWTIDVPPMPQVAISRMQII